MFKGRRISKNKTCGHQDDDGIGGTRGKLYKISKCFDCKFILCSVIGQLLDSIAPPLQLYL